MSDRRRFGHVNVICGCEFTCVVGKGRKRGLKMGQLTWSMRPARAEVGNYIRTYEEPPFQVRGLFFTFIIHEHHTWNNILYTILCVKKNTFSPKKETM